MQDTDPSGRAEQAVLLQELQVGGLNWQAQLQACVTSGKPVLLRDFSDARNTFLADLLQLRVRSTYVSGAVTYWPAPLNSV